MFFLLFAIIIIQLMVLTIIIETNSKAKFCIAIFGLLIGAFGLLGAFSVGL